LLSSSLLIFGAATAKSGLTAQDFTLSEDIGKYPVINARVSSGFNEVNKFRGSQPHKGVDFTAPHGSDIVASFSGRVIVADAKSLHKNYGKVVLVQQSNKQYLYAHLDSFNVKVGQFIMAGEKLGTVGITGRVTGPHLHFAILQDGNYLDPSLYLNLEPKN